MYPRVKGVVTSRAMQSVAEFFLLFRQPIKLLPYAPDEARRKLRLELIKEEFAEFAVASSNGDVVGVADALGDLLYVIYGAALEWGIPLDAVFAEIHCSNMTKMWPGKGVKYRADGKVLKPPTYSPADVAGVLAKTHLPEGWDRKKAQGA